MGLIEDDEVAVQVPPAVHRVVELIPEDLGRSDDDGGVGVFLRIPGHDADVGRLEVVAEFDPFGIGQGLEGEAYQQRPPLRKTERIASSAIQVFPEPVGAMTRQSLQPDRFEGV